MGTLSVTLFGSFQASIDAQPIGTFRTNKAQALLVYLVVERDRAHRREALYTLLWPDMPLPSAQTNLRQVLYRLRQMFPDLSDGKNEAIPLLLTDRQTVRLNPDAALEVDLHRFDALLAGVQGHQHPGLASCAPCLKSLETAAALYRGDFLDDFYLDDSNEFEDWAHAIRETCRGKALGALEDLTGAYLGMGAYDKATQTARRQLTLDPLRESAHRELIEALARNGRRRAAITHFEAFQEQLQDELGLDPSQETQRLAAAIRNGALEPAPPDSQTPAPKQQTKVDQSTETIAEKPNHQPAIHRHPIRHNLPTQPTPFIGRETELTSLDRLLADPDIRLVTIVGPGGMGKTRLSLAWAEQQLTRMNGLTGDRPDRPYMDGIFFVDLAPLSDPGQIISAVADALNFPLQAEDPRTPQQQLLGYLSQKKTLLLLDNFEHLLDGVDLVADILRAAAGVQILATSRERLHLPHEQVYPVVGLEFPDWETPEDALEYTAVRLFIQSAQRNQPDFALDDGDDLTYLARICRLVAGLPLALELAAAWVDVLPLEEIADGLQQGLDFLETDMHGVPERHRSVRASIDYSWGKLDEKERDVFASLSVFRGGFTREAAREVAGANLRQLGRLVNKSFLRYDQASDRYQLHELLRQYGEEKLAKTGQETAVRDHHSQFFCAALHAWEKGLKSEQMRATAVEIEADYRNIESAWDNALTQGHFEQLILAINGLGTYFDVQNRWFEGLNLFRESARQLQIDKDVPPPSPETARLIIWLQSWQANLNINMINHIDFANILQPAFDLLGLPVLSDEECRAEEAYLRLQLGRVLKLSPAQREDGQAHLDVCLQLYRAIENPLGVADALYEAHFYALEKGLYEQAKNLLQESITLLQAAGDPWRLTRVLIGMGNLYRSLGAHAATKSMYDQAYDTAQRAGHLGGLVDACRFSLQHAWELGEFDISLHKSQEFMALVQQTNNPFTQASALRILGMLQVYRGQFAVALEHFQEAKRHEKKIDLPAGSYAWVSLGLPQIDLHTGQYEKSPSWPQTYGERWWIIVQQMWAALVRKVSAETVVLAQQALNNLPRIDLHTGKAEISTPLALALFELGQVDKARRELYQGLNTCLEIRAAFIQLMPMIPVIARVLGDADNPKQKERAVELWAMAKALPFVGSSKMFSDLLDGPMAAVAAALPPAVVEAAQARGRELDWWDTAQTLLGELTAWGWGREPERKTEGAQPAEPQPAIRRQEIRHNLPAQPTSFIGRETELTSLDQLFANPDIRLVTIVGPGGMGKTRLALAWAERQLANLDGSTGDRPDRPYMDGIFFVDLAPLDEPAQIVPAVVEALQIQIGSGEAGTPQEQLLAYLADKQMLFILDNFEHLLAGAGLAAKMLSAAPEVQIIATSRERLHLRGEQLYPIQGLEFPDWVSPEDAAEYTASQLFLNAARRIRPGFELGEDDLLHLTRICQLMDGMPLALELAAGWVELLPLAEIAAEIERGLGLLETDLQDVPERQRSIQAVFESTWEQLTPAEQHFMQKLSVFRGGFTLEAASQVAGDQVSPAVSLRMLSRLVSKSLLQADPTRGRYQVHELLRKYAAEQLENRGETDATRTVHAAYFLDLLHQQEADVRGGREQKKALDTIEANFANIRAAWDWALAQGELEAIDRSLETLCWFCWFRTRSFEGVELFQQTEAQIAPGPERYSNKTWRRVAARRIFLDQQAWVGDLGEKLVEIEKILAEARQAEDLVEIAFALHVLGILRIDRNHSAGIKNLEESLSIYHRLEDSFQKSRLLGSISWYYSVNGHSQKRFEMAIEQLAMAQRNGDRLTAADAQGVIGQVAERAGRYAEAETIYQEVLPVFREFGDQFHISEYIIRLGELAFLDGDFGLAKSCIIDVQALARQFNLRSIPFFTHGTQSMIYITEKQYQKAFDRSDITRFGHPMISFSALRGLTYAKCGLGDFSAAKGYLKLALEKATIYKAVAWEVHCLPAAALIAASDDRLERAAELLVLGYQHPTAATGWQDQFPLITRLRTRLEAELPPETLKAAQERGAVLDLAETIKTILETLT